MSEKDFKKYCYFLSKAKNYAVCIKPEKKAIIDGEVVIKDEGLRVEFKNKMLRVEKNKLGNVVINFLRKKIEEEKDLSPNARMIFEEKEPDEMIPVREMEEKLEDKNKEINQLKEELQVKK